MESALSAATTTGVELADTAQVAAQVDVLRGLLDKVDVALAPGADDGTATFLGAFTILLREGVEALLVVVAFELA